MKKRKNLLKHKFIEAIFSQVCHLMKQQEHKKPPPSILKGGFVKMIDQISEITPQSSFNEQQNGKLRARGPVKSAVFASAAPSSPKSQKSAPVRSRHAAVGTPDSKQSTVQLEELMDAADSIKCAGQNSARVQNIKRRMMETRNSRPITAHPHKDNADDDRLANNSNQSDLILLNKSEVRAGSELLMTPARLSSTSFDRVNSAKTIYPSRRMERDKCWRQIRQLDVNRQRHSIPLREESKSAELHLVIPSVSTYSPETSISDQERDIVNSDITDQSQASSQLKAAKKDRMYLLTAMEACAQLGPDTCHVCRAETRSEWYLGDAQKFEPSKSTTQAIKMQKNRQNLSRGLTRSFTAKAPHQHRPSKHVEQHQNTPEKKEDILQKAKANWQKDPFRKLLQENNKRGKSEDQTRGDHADNERAVNKVSILSDSTEKSGLKDTTVFFLNLSDLNNKYVTGKIQFEEKAHNERKKSSGSMLLASQQAQIDTITAQFFKKENSMDTIKIEGEQDGFQPPLVNVDQQQEENCFFAGGGNDDFNQKIAAFSIPERPPESITTLIDDIVSSPLFVLKELQGI